MDKNFIIGMVLIFLILFAWQSLGPKPQPVKPGAENAQDQGAAPETPAVTPEGQGTTTATDAAAPAATPASAVADATTETPKTAAVEIPVAPPVELKDEFVTASFTNVGGRIESWRLNKFNDKAGPKGVPLEMVSMRDAGKFPMGTYWSGFGPTLSENDPYEIVQRGPDKVVFTRTDAAGFKITKTFEPNFKFYSVKMTVEIENPGQAFAKGRLSATTFRDAGPVVKKSFFSPNMDVISFLADVGGDLKKTEIRKAGGTAYKSNVLWAGFENIYFFTALAPAVSETAETQVVAPKTAEEPFTAAVMLPETQIAPGGRASFEFFAYFGPKTETTLFGAGHSFDQAIDFGWFTVIAKWLVRALQTLYKWTGNWGVAIIIATVIIKILTLPLTQKSYKSMKAMSVLQPEMQKLREKYKDDREKLNQETMALYKAHGVNPASGCLPLLIQLPIFLAFYRALYGTIELRHSPFMLWIMDLSAPDPYYVLPIIMGVTMLITQKMTPSSADPMQNKIMMIMPVVFTFMFLNFPSGLVVYWLVNNILTIFQQMYMRRGDKGKPTMVPAKA